MIRRKLAALALALGLLGGVVAVSVTPQPAAAIGYVHTLTNGSCTVKVGFTNYAAWVQVWSSGCRYVEIQATDYGCYYWTGHRSVLGSPIPLHYFMQTYNVPNAKPVYWAYIYTRSMSGYIRDGMVGIWGRVSGW
jgi:hypothetical protein